MKLRLLSLAALLISSVASFAQGAQSFKISEIYFAGPETESYLDEYGDKSNWIEITNTSWSTHNLSSCYLTNNPKALDENLSVPEREKLLSLINKGDSRTNLNAKKRVVFFADGNVNRGVLHTNFTINLDSTVFIALYDGNAKTLLDSVTIPAGTLKAGQSYARTFDSENNSKWVVKNTKEVTPNEPCLGESVNNKIAEWKREDPYGIAMTIVSMAIVLGCLALLYIFFYIFGWILNRFTMLARVKAIRKLHEEAAKVKTIAKQGLETQGIEYENYMAAIALALHEYFGGTHDIESGVLTIEHHNTAWNAEARGMTIVPDVDVTETDIPVQKD